MFTGIVEEVGKVAKKLKVREGYRFRIGSLRVIKNLNESDSVAVNGVCLTVTGKRKHYFDVTAVQETLKKTTLGGLEPGDELNLESSLRIGEEIGGHFVFGHVDDTAVVSALRQVSPKIKRFKNSKSKRLKDSKSWEVNIKIKNKYRKYVIPAGSIAVNGVSLTVAKIIPTSKESNYFGVKVAIIPYTYKNTTFKNLKVNDKVNIEFDFLGKYVLNILEKKKINR